jgi:methylamine dehydrogenase light chain
MRWLDHLTEKSARAIAKRTSRRSFLGSLGVSLVGAAALPLLPIARGSAGTASPPSSTKTQTPAEKSQDPTHCEYWRHCAIDGYLCGCCGGSQDTCPPGTTQSPITWVGTCHNPTDGRDYVVSYNDCCGKASCGRCLCNRNERDSPLYVPFQSNDYNWCSGNIQTSYHCSTSRIVGVAK